jgi:hypothetical protein
VISRNRFSKSLSCRQSITPCADHAGRISALMRSTKVMQSIAVCWSVCCSRFADRCQLGDDTVAEESLWETARRKVPAARLWRGISQFK